MPAPRSGLSTEEEPMADLAAKLAELVALQILRGRVRPNQFVFTPDKKLALVIVRLNDAAARRLR